jgi:hypothetical protein
LEDASYERLNKGQGKAKENMKHYVWMWKVEIPKVLKYIYQYPYG